MPEYDGSSGVPPAADTRNWVLERIRTLVRAESPSTDKAAVDRCGALLEGMLREQGALISRLPQIDRGDHFRAEFPGGAAPGAAAGALRYGLGRGQLSGCHCEKQDGRLHGPGVFDMKASIAMAISPSATLSTAAARRLPAS